MKRIAAIAAALVLAAGGAIALQLDRAEPPLDAPRATASRPTLALLTSLPIVFGERFGLGAGGSPALERLEQRYDVVPIGLADADQLRDHRLLLMAHPRAQPAEVLVELDSWVRKGGRLVLLADPRLEWESSLPLGDPLRPPPYFADTGLLGHWGLSLDENERGQGTLRRTGAQCSLHSEEVVARCAIGRGQATVIADADFLMSANGDGFDLMFRELARVEPR